MSDFGNGGWLLGTATAQSQQPASKVQENRAKHLRIGDTTPIDPNVVSQQLSNNGAMTTAALAAAVKRNARGMVSVMLVEHRDDIFRRDAATLFHQLNNPGALAMRFWFWHRLLTLCQLLHEMFVTANEKHCYAPFFQLHQIVFETKDREGNNANSRNLLASAVSISEGWDLAKNHLDRFYLFNLG
ncbi:hypothetical protein [Enterobacter mori]